MQTVAAQNYFRWMTSSTPTLFWQDSLNLDEIRAAVENGARGVTANPVIALRCIQSEPDKWADKGRELLRRNPELDSQELALRLVNAAIAEAARLVRPIWEQTGGAHGYVTGQVNPLRMNDAEPMLRQALETSAMEPNMAMKIPTTAAGIEIIEELGARGVTCVSTVAYSVAQAIAAQEAYERGRARGNGHRGHAINYSVMIIGRLDEYLQKKVEIEGREFPRELIDCAGLAVTKKLNRIFAERGYPGMILTGGTRRRHIDLLAGARMCMTIGTQAQQEILDENPEQRPRAEEPVEDDIIAQLSARFPEFVQAYEEDGLRPDEFTEFGPCRTMHDWFIEAFRETMRFGDQLR